MHSRTKRAGYYKLSAEILTDQSRSHLSILVLLNDKWHHQRNYGIMSNCHLGVWIIIFHIVLLRLSAVQKLRCIWEVLSHKTHILRPHTPDGGIETSYSIISLFIQKGNWKILCNLPFIIQSSVLKFHRPRFVIFYGLYMHYICLTALWYFITQSGFCSIQLLETLNWDWTN